MTADHADFVDCCFLVMGDTNNVGSITITITFRTSIGGIDYSNDYLLRNFQNVVSLLKLRHESF